jgi:hypothetical protein
MTRIEPELPRDTGSAPRLRPLGAAERTAHPPRTTRPPRLWPWVAGAAAVVVGCVAALLLEHFEVARRHPGAPPAPLDASRLIWPAVAVAVLLALFFVARRVTSGGRASHETWHA